MGILKAFLGLSASIYSTMYLATYAPDAVNFLYVLSVGPPIVALVLSLFVNLVPHRTAADSSRHQAWSNNARFNTAFALVTAVATYQLVSALYVAYGDPKTILTLKWICAGLVVLLLSNVIPAYGAGSGSRTPQHTEADLTTAEAGLPQPLLSDDDQSECDGLDADTATEQAPDAQHRPDPSAAARGSSSQQCVPSVEEDDFPNYTTGQLAVNVDYWLLLVVFGVAVGAGLAMLNNLAQLVSALGGPVGGQVSCREDALFVRYTIHRFMHLRIDLPCHLDDCMPSRFQGGSTVASAPPQWWLGCRWRSFRSPQLYCNSSI